MTTFAMGFLFITAFTMLLGFGTAIFLSLDVDRSDTLPSDTSKTGRINIVRHLDTCTIETVDNDGEHHIWKRAS
ncbi:MAG: hypothetical protein AAFQ07_10515 [Chloroflexota bacterium]